MPTKNQTSKRTSQSPDDLVREYKNYFYELSTMFFEREWEIKQIMLAVLVREHVLLKGLPGTAKTMLAKKVFNGFVGAEVYSNQFTRMQDDAYVFGPQLLEEFKRGVIKHNISNSLVTAHFGMLDEVFNASEETLNSMLEILNERTFTRPHQKETANLITAIMTTNQERETERELSAVYDRILFKSDVKDITSFQNRIKMYTDFIEGKNVDYQPEYPFDNLQELLQLFDSATFVIPESVLFIFDSVVTEYVAQSGKRISPRTRNKCLNIIKAAAFLDERDEVTIDDIEAIKYALVEGGDAKAKTFFETVFAKVKKGLDDVNVIQKMEVLFESNKQEKDKSKQYRIALGLSKKIDKMMGEMQSNPAGAVYVSMLENLAGKVADFLKSIDQSDIDKDLFNL